MDAAQSTTWEIGSPTECELRGDMTVGKKTVIHQNVMIVAEDGPIFIGENNLIKEFVVIRNRKAKPEDESQLMVIGDGNIFYPRSKVESLLIGSNNVFETNSYVGRHTSLTNGCIIGSKCEITSEEEIPENIIVYGPSCERRLKEEVLHPPAPKFLLLEDDQQPGSSGLACAGPINKASDSAVQVSPPSTSYAGYELKGKVILGKNNQIYPGARILAEGSAIYIGDNNIIKNNVVIRNRLVPGKNIPTIIGHHNTFEVGCYAETLKIGDNNFLGKNVFIDRTAFITSECVIGARSVLPSAETLPWRISFKTQLMDVQDKVAKTSISEEDSED